MQPRRQRPRGQRVEVTLGQAFGVRRVHVSHNRHGDIGRHVILIEELFGIGPPQADDVAGPSSRRIAIGVGRERGGQQILNELALRTRFDAHAVLFQHHLALFVELAEHRPQEALRFHQEPKLRPVGRQAVVILGGIERSAGVHARAPVGFDDAEIHVRHHEGFRAVDGHPHLRLEHTDPGGVGFGSLVALGLEAVVCLLDGIQGFLLGRPVAGSDGFRALEGHVLEHVGDAGFTGRIVHRPGVHIGVE